MNNNTQTTVAELRDTESKFPVDAQPVTEHPPIPHTSKLSAYNFTQTGPYSVGLSKEQAAQTLTDLAEKILAGSILVQRVQVTSEAHRSNYPFTALVLEFHEKT